ncbi:MAG: hypothetical protein FWF16_12840 [Microbacteriaceae bacterium]|nr:hypothetical protein [Microbacteriaceae bacterium]
MLAAMMLSGCAAIAHDSAGTSSRSAAPHASASPSGSATPTPKALHNNQCAAYSAAISLTPGEVATIMGTAKTGPTPAVLAAVADEAKKVHAAAQKVTDPTLAALARAYDRDASGYSTALHDLVADPGNAALDAKQGRLDIQMAQDVGAITRYCDS